MGKALAGLACSPPSPRSPLADRTGPSTCSSTSGPRASAVGGSHAQRDIIDLTLIAAAARAGDDGLARALVTRTGRPQAHRRGCRPPADRGERRLPDALRW